MTTTRWIIVLAALAPELAAGAPDAPGPSDDWRLFAATRLAARGLEVDGGAVGANERVTVTRPLVAPRSVVASDEVALDPGVELRRVVGRGNAGAGCGPRVPVTTPILPGVPPTCLSAPPPPSWIHRSRSWWATA